ncbi:MAG: DsbA family protein [Rhizobacter sp.]|nr:DsbA family protein [Rhizobacter sp.]
MQLVYVADPMCSWCYGFARPMQALLAEPGEFAPIDISLVMGGLRPFTREAMTPERVDEILTHWHHVHEASGQPFAKAPDTAMHRPGFVYDTEPASRATVTVRTDWPQQAWAYFESVQRAFYAEARDVTQTAVLTMLAERLGVPGEAFRAAFESDRLRQATLQDFAQSQRWGIRGFPALIAQHRGQLHQVCNGYAPIETVRQRLGALMAPTA